VWRGGWELSGSRGPEAVLTLEERLSTFTQKKELKLRVATNASAEGGEPVATGCL